jgi:hypothetical protein
MSHTPTPEPLPGLGDPAVPWSGRTLNLWPMPTQPGVPTIVDQPKKLRVSSVCALRASLTQGR